MCRGFKLTFQKYLKYLYHSNNNLRVFNHYESTVSSIIYPHYAIIIITKNLIQSYCTVCVWLCVFKLQIIRARKSGRKCQVVIKHVGHKTQVLLYCTGNLIFNFVHMPNYCILTVHPLRLAWGCLPLKTFDTFKKKT